MDDGARGKGGYTEWAPLLSFLPPPAHAGALQAQYSCEQMAGRGVRISRDITSEWTRLTGGLLDRIPVVDLTQTGERGHGRGGDDKHSIWPALPDPGGGHDRGVTIEG